MMTIKAINNNADSIRVINHGTKFNKTDVLMYAEHIIQTKYTRIFKYPARAYVSYKIAGGRAAIRHKIPARREHLLTIEQCAPIDNYILDDEYYNDIIIPATRDNIGINNSKYSELYETIEKYADDMAGELIDVKNGVSDYYETAAECITDYLNIDDISDEHAETIARAAWRYYDNKISFNEYAAELLTALTPHKWRAVTLRGYCQSDVVRAIYPADVYSDADISEYECYYFGMYFNYCATYKNMSVWYTYTDNTPTADIIDEIRADYSTNNIKYCPAY